MAQLELVVNKQTNEFRADLLNNSKFSADAFNYEDASFFIIMNGVNLSFKSANKNNNIKFVINSYQKHGDKFFSEFRGSFSGILYDKKEKKWIIFTNHTGDQKLFYIETENSLFVYSDLYRLKDQLKDKNISYSLNVTAAYYLITYGYMTDDSTIIRGVKRLTAGRYLILKENTLENNRYFTLHNTPNHKLTTNEAIEQIDELFHKAIQLEYDKDIQYNYKHIAAMSGGLDCRMTNWVANKSGYRDCTNYTYSQAGYLDMIIAKQMSTYLGNEWIFRDLGKGDFLEDIDELTRISNACFRSTVRTSITKTLDFSQYGLIHSGQLGDAILSTHCPETGYNPASKIKATSHTLLKKVKLDYTQWENEEIANIEVRGFNGMLSGNFTYQPFTEVSSPFADPDFINFVLTIPLSMRGYHSIYKKWILMKYPDAAKFKWENINAKINEKTINIRNKIIPLKQLPKFIFSACLYNFGIDISQGKKLQNTNPFDYWYKTNPGLKNYLDTYFDTNIILITEPELKSDVSMLYAKGAMTDKLQALTLLAAIKGLEL